MSISLSSSACVMGVKSLELKIPVNTGASHSEVVKVVEVVEVEFEGSEVGGGG